MAGEAIWTTKEIILAILGTGIVSGFASFVIDYFRARSGRGRKKMYMCMRVAVALEEYAIRCAELVDATEAHFAQTNSPLSTNVPDPPVYPEDIDWQSIDPGTAYKAMSFLNECQAQAVDARYVYHFEGNPFGIAEATKNSGRKAYELANVLRRTASLPSPEFVAVLQPLFK